MLKVTLGRIKGKAQYAGKWAAFEHVVQGELLQYPSQTFVCDGVKFCIWVKLLHATMRWS